MVNLSLKSIRKVHTSALPCSERPFPLKMDSFMFKKFTVVGQYGTHIDAIHFFFNRRGRWLGSQVTSKISSCRFMLSTVKEVAVINFYLEQTVSSDLKVTWTNCWGAFVAFPWWLLSMLDQIYANLDEMGFNKVQDGPVCPNSWFIDHVRLLVMKPLLIPILRYSAAEYGLVNSTTSWNKISIKLKSWIIG